MPRAQWGMIFACISLMYFTEAEIMWFYKHFGLSAGMSKGEWFVAVLGIFAVFAGLGYWYKRRARKGKVKANGLEGEKRQAIPFGSIERIVLEGGGFLAVVFMANGREKMHLTDSELIKLTRTSLNEWEVKGDKVTITHGEKGQEMQIVYTLRGKYATGRLGMLEALIVGIFCVAVGGILVFGWDAFPVFWACIAGYSILFIVQRYYRRVKVSVMGDELRFTEGKQERSVIFGNVVCARKGVFRIMVTTKNGEEFFFPQGCVLLPEIVEGLR